MVEDKRFYGRVNIEKEISCLVNKVGSQNIFEAGVKEIGPGGLCLVADREIPEGVFLEIQLNFTSQSLNDIPPVSGKVVHCSRDEEAKKYNMRISYTRHDKHSG